MEKLELLCIMGGINRTTIWSCNSPSRYIPKNIQSKYSDTCSQHYWQQSKGRNSPNAHWYNNWINKIWYSIQCIYVYNGILNGVECSVVPDSLWPTDYSPPGSSVHGIFLARILEWVAMFSFRGSSQVRDQTCISCMAGVFFTTEAPGKPQWNITQL